MLRAVNNRFFSARTATAVIVANMIGTGVFTSLGFQLNDLSSGPVLLSLWLIGGLVALCGALCYAELGAALPRSGGEYHFVGRIFHPSLGFASGWISATVGFAAPTALAAVTCASYVHAVHAGVAQRPLAIGIIVALTLVHATSRRQSGAVQTLLTLIKLGVILAFCIAAAVRVDSTAWAPLAPGAFDPRQMSSGAFAVALIYVSYAYSGWNAATYVFAELEKPQKQLPAVLIAGTCIVTLLYVGLNAAFLISAPTDALRGQLEVGYIAAQSIFGDRTADAIGLTLAALLTSTVSAMLLAAPRVLQVIGQDYAVFARLARENSHGVPATAIYVQGATAVIFVVSGSFETILLFSGFVLALNTLVTVLGLIILRVLEPGLARPFRVPLYPLPPLVFLALTCWTLVFVFLDNPIRSALGLALVAMGCMVWSVAQRFEEKS
ncbi:MAG: amino acid permease [Pseudomonadota bacterium]